ncbi:unnamed protein product [Auanema sp. JU1783]|nr:unnamed protein product [Auanema sp. JU1783]
MPYVGIGAQPDSKTSLVGKPMLKVYALILFSIFLTFGIALLGKYHKDHPTPVQRSVTINDVHESISSYLIDAVNGTKMKENLRLLTKEPHLAGSEANKKVAYKIAKLWADAGLEDVHFIPYEVLLSYPNVSSLNRVILDDSRGKNIFTSSGMSPAIIQDEQKGKYAGVQWLAWAATGRVTADVVYVNRGKEEDFENLKNMGVDPEGKIALMRYGEGFRGDKVHIAQKYGAVGAILFSDPSDVAREGIDKAHIYPRTVWMPEEGVQRGSTMHGDGDPLTPLYPSKKELFSQRTIEQAKKDGIIPSIPVLPVSYTTAWQILSRMAGRPVPLNWQGFINVTYRVGPGFRNKEKLTIDVSGYLQKKTIRNVVGYIRGHDEPDRYVILGNHYDAWVYGAMDPNSGTAMLAEVARAMMQTVNQTNWRPARTIMFTAWDAEEYGLVGSTEFVEEFHDILRKRAVVYLNMDCLQGNSSLHVFTIPTLYKVAIEVSKKIANPNPKEKAKGRETLFDSWVKTFPSGQVGVPKIPVPSGGSDHAPFLNYAGVPVIDFNFKNTSTFDTYPLYHSLYETPFLNEHLLDPNNFVIHKALGQYWAELARVFVDEAVLPFNSTELAATFIKEYLPILRKELSDSYYFPKAIEPARIQLNLLSKTAQDFYEISKKFEASVTWARAVFSQNPYDNKQITAVNERMMSLERCFINPRGIPGAPASRHVLFSVSAKDSYSSAVMAAISDAVDAFKKAETDLERIELGREVAHQISIVQFSIICAINTLRENI